MKKLIPLALLAVTATAFAASLNFTWEHATEYTDGSAIAASGSEALASTEIVYGPCNSGRTDILSPQTVVVPYPAKANVVQNLEPGIWCGKARHLTVGGTPGMYTDVVATEKAPRQPKAPSNFSFGS